MSAHAAAHGAVNLGQGYPDFDGPTEVLEAAIDAIRGGHNQYAPGRGIPELRAAVAHHQQRFWGLGYDPDSEVLITAGATEAITAAVLALCEVGQEVVVLEPAYDSYLAAIALAGAIPRPVPLRPPSWTLDLEELEAAVTDRTRLVIVNTPHNPTGRVLDDTELGTIARLCVERDLVAVTDEVYEHLVYDGAHRPLASWPGMRERTITVSSAAKTLSVTGWKVGWVCAPAPLLDAVLTVKQYLTFTNGTPFQHAVAVGLGLPDGYFAELAACYRRRRDRLRAALEGVGFRVLPSAATYFLICDTAPLGEPDAVALAWRLPVEAGVAAIPVAAFHTDPRRNRSLLRFAFCRTDGALDEAGARLQRWAEARR